MSQQDKERKPLTREELGERFQVTSRTIKFWETSGDLPKPVFLGRRAFHFWDVVENHLKGRKGGPSGMLGPG